MYELHIGDDYLTVICENGLELITLHPSSDDKIEARRMVNKLNDKPKPKTTRQKMRDLNRKLYGV